MCIIMVCALRYIDVRWLMPKRKAFADGIDNGEIVIAGHAVKTDGSDGEAEVVVVDGLDTKQGAKVSVKGEASKGTDTI